MSFRTFDLNLLRIFDAISCTSKIGISDPSA